MLVLLLLAVLLFIVNLFNSIIDLSKNLVRAFVTALISSYTWQFSMYFYTVTSLEKDDKA